MCELVTPFGVVNCVSESQMYAPFVDFVKVEKSGFSGFAANEVRTISCSSAI